VERRELDAALSLSSPRRLRGFTLLIETIRSGRPDVSGHYEAVL